MMAKDGEAGNTATSLECTAGEYCMGGSPTGNDFKMPLADDDSQGTSAGEQPSTSRVTTGMTEVTFAGDCNCIPLVESYAVSVAAPSEEDVHPEWMQKWCPFLHSLFEEPHRRRSFVIGLVAFVMVVAIAYQHISCHIGFASDTDDAVEGCPTIMSISSYTELVCKATLAAIVVKGIMDPLGPIQEIRERPLQIVPSLVYLAFPGIWFLIRGDDSPNVVLQIEGVYEHLCMMVVVLAITAGLWDITALVLAGDSHGAKMCCLSAALLHSDLEEHLSHAPAPVFSPRHSWSNRTGADADATPRSSDGLRRSNSLREAGRERFRSQCSQEGEQLAAALERGVKGRRRKIARTVVMWVACLGMAGLYVAATWVVTNWEDDEIGPPAWLDITFRFLDITCHAGITAMVVCSFVQWLWGGARSLRTAARARRAVRDARASEQAGANALLPPSNEQCGHPAP